MSVVNRRTKAPQEAMTARRRPTDKLLINRFIDIVGQANAITSSDAQQPYLREWRDRYVGATPVVLKPGSTQDVAAILALANATRTPVVPQGGNTGLVGGQIPSPSSNEIVIALSRLDRVRSVDPLGGHMICEAGVTLSDAQSAADHHDRLFPLSLASEGTCQIGGNLAANAGGTAVLAYGNTRTLTSGVEVVLPDGRILNNLNTLKKDNTGYDLTNLFVGSEGTLGIITAAALKLFPKPKRLETAFVATASLNDLAALFTDLTDNLGPQLTAFEFLPQRAIGFLLRHIDGARAPVAPNAPWYALIEVSHLSSSEADEPTVEDPTASATTVLERRLTHAVEHAAVIDVAIAASQAQRADFWRLRELMSEVQKYEGGSIKHDISVPVAAIPAFIEKADAMVTNLIPGARPVPFGHFGDGNVHYNISQPANGNTEQFLAQWDEISHAVHRLVTDFGGAISAEHGIGQMKRKMLADHKDPVALSLMRTLKQAIDPHGIMNPGKVL